MSVLSTTPPSPPSSTPSSPKIGKSPAPWQPDEEAKNCTDCQRPFTFTRRRHHCRVCGLIFCHPCSRHELIIPTYGSKEPQRACNSCKQNSEQEEKEKWSKWEKVADWDILMFLGEGAFGKVYKVKHKSTNEIFAMKVVEKRKLRTNQAKTAMKEEKLLLQTLTHPFIVKLHCSFQTHDKLFMIMDFLPGGDCYYLMTRARFPEDVVRLHSSQIALALDYIHQQNIVYRDLKPENCVLDSRGNMVLTDFGLAKEIDEGGYRGTQVGTPDYWAPEMFRGLKYGKAVDFWALGCLIYELITGKHPFLDEKGVVPQYKVLEEEPNLRHKSIRISEACDQLVRLLLTKSADDRLQTLSHMKQLAWYSSIDWDAVYRREVPIPGNWKPPTGDAFDPCFTSQAPVIKPSTSPGENYAGFTWQEKSEYAHKEPELG